MKSKRSALLHNDNLIESYFKENFCFYLKNKKKLIPITFMLIFLFVLKAHLFFSSINLYSITIFINMYKRETHTHTPNGAG